MKLIEIAAVGKNYELGKNNDLIWHLKGDMQFFRQTTKGQIVLMGRKTYESLPHLLPGRHHIVISRSDPFVEPEVEVFSTIDAFMKAYKEKDVDVYVIGGAQIYAQMLPYADELLLTHIQDAEDADVYFPMFDSSLYEKTVLAEDEENDVVYEIVKYTKQKI